MPKYTTKLWRFGRNNHQEILFFYLFFVSRVSSLCVHVHVCACTLYQLRLVKWGYTWIYKVNKVSQSQQSHPTSAKPYIPPLRHVKTLSVIFFSMAAKCLFYGLNDTFPTENMQLHHLKALCTSSELSTPLSFSAIALHHVCSLMSFFYVFQLQRQDTSIALRVKKSVLTTKPRWCFVCILFLDPKPLMLFLTIT